MRFRWLMALLLLSTLLVQRVAWAGLYEEARNSVSVETQQDRSGFTVRGGINLRTGQTPEGKPLLRSQASTGKLCGAFDFKASMQEAFEDTPQLVTALAMNVAQSLPLLGTCYLDPTLC